MPQIEVRAIENLRAEQGKRNPRLIGYGVKFDRWSHPIRASDGLEFRESIAPGAFAISLDRGDDVLALREHDPMQILGRRASGTLKVFEDNVGLRLEVDLPDTELGHETLELVQRGDLRGCSFCFAVPKGGDSFSPDWRRRTVHEADLHDVSIVARPCYDQTEIAARRIDYAAEKGHRRMEMLLDRQRRLRLGIV